MRPIFLVLAWLCGYVLTVPLIKSCNRYVFADDNPTYPVDYQCLELAWFNIDVGAGESIREVSPRCFKQFDEAKNPEQWIDMRKL